MKGGGLGEGGQGFPEENTYLAMYIRRDKIIFNELFFNNVTIIFTVEYKLLQESKQKKLGFFLS